MAKTNLILVRHGQSLGNATRTILGHTDLDLSELGYKQASAVAEYLKNNKKIDKIYSSDLKRAFNTVKTYGDMVGMEVIPSKMLREVSVGDWEGRRVDDLIEEYGEMYTVDWSKRYGTFKFPGGEGTIAAGERFYNEIRKICLENEGKTLLIGAHAAVIRSFWSIVAGIKPEELNDALPFPTNASCSTMSFDGEDFILGEFSYDEYLSGMMSPKLF